MSTYSVYNIKIDNKLQFASGPTAGYVLAINADGSTSWIQGGGGSQNLQQVLAQGNSVGTYSINGSNSLLLQQGQYITNPGGTTYSLPQKISFTDNYLQMSVGGKWNYGGSEAPSTITIGTHSIQLYAGQGAFYSDGLGDITLIGNTIIGITSSLLATDATGKIIATASSAGSSGTSGSSGSSGTSGVSGSAGSSGTSGVSGSAGSSGTSGISGSSGLSGTSGSSGSSGSSGTSGVSPTLAASMNSKVSTPANPVAFGNNAGEMGGIGFTFSTQQTNSVFFSITGDLVPSASSTYDITIQYGTGSVPANNTPQVGTEFLKSQLDLADATDTIPFTLSGILTGLVNNQVFWYDLSVKNSVGPNTITFKNLRVSIIELSGGIGATGDSGSSGTSGIGGTSGSSGTSGTSVAAFPLTTSAEARAIAASASAGAGAVTIRGIGISSIGQPVYQSNITYKDMLACTPFRPQKNFTSTGISIANSLASAAGRLIIAIYDDNNGYPNNLMTQSTEISWAATGVKTFTYSTTYQAGTTYWIGIHTNGQFQFHNLSTSYPTETYGYYFSAAFTPTRLGGWVGNASYSTIAPSNFGSCSTINALGTTMPWFCINY